MVVTQGSKARLTHPIGGGKGAISSTLWSLSSNYLNEYEINNDRYIIYIYIYILFIKINYFELVLDLFI